MRGIASLFRKLLGLPQPDPQPHVFVPADNAWHPSSLREALHAWKLHEYADELLAMSRFAFALHAERVSQHSLSQGASRLGGLPDLPAAHTWPVWRGRSMNFIAQIDLQNLAKLAPDNPLPHTGSLCFWYDLMDMPWESCKRDAGGFLVQHIPAPIDELRRRALPNDYYFQDDAKNGTKTYTPCQLDVKVVTSLPELPDEYLDARWIRNEHIEQFETFLRAFRGRVLSPEPRSHQLLGHPWFIQGSMHEDIAMSEWRRQPENANASAYQPRELTESLAAEWRLLAQFDTDPATGFEWGDSGTIYYFIRHDDLAAGRFDRVRGKLECY